MRILAMDTTGRQGSVALLEEDKTIGSAQLTESDRHVVALPRQIDRLLHHAEWSMAEIDLVGVTLGPGSFTGLRIALGVAKGIALGQKVPVVGLSTLDTVAAGSHARQEGEWIVSVLDARRHEVFFGLYQLQKDGFPDPVQPASIVEPQRLAQILAEDTTKGEAPLYFNGSGLGAYAAVFREALGDRMVASPESAWQPDAVRLGQQALRRYQQEGAMPASEWHPLYLRRPDAVAKKSGL